MPRERIQHGKMYVLEKPNSANPDSEDSGRLWHPGEPLSKDEFLREDPSLDVHWNRDGEYVQISIDAPKDWWERFYKSREQNDQITAFAAFTDRLPRKEINHLIRTLRRARDAAYGADE